jgi:hypothetical protein
MPVRILTGIVNVGSAPGPKAGSVTIGFNPFARTAGTVPIVELGEVGPAARFNSVPGKMVALRQISIPVSSDNMRFRVDDDITRDDLTIRWSGDGACFSEEISFLVFGEVPEPIPVPPRLPVKPVRPGPRVPSQRRRVKKGKKGKR